MINWSIYCAVIFYVKYRNNKYIMWKRWKMTSLTLQTWHLDLLLSQSFLGSCERGNDSIMNRDGESWDMKHSFISVESVKSTNDFCNLHKLSQVWVLDSTLRNQIIHAHVNDSLQDVENLCLVRISTRQDKFLDWPADEGWWSGSLWVSLLYNLILEDKTVSCIQWCWNLIKTVEIRKRRDSKYVCEVGPGSGV